MGLRDMWWGCKEWLAVLVFISVLISSTVWYLSFNPQYVAIFLATTVIAIGFMMVMVLLPKHRHLEYQVKKREVMGRVLYHYHRKPDANGRYCSFFLIFAWVLLGILTVWVAKHG